jgi:hypothetical protein
MQKLIKILKLSLEQILACTARTKWLKLCGENVCCENKAELIAGRQMQFLNIKPGVMRT